MSRSNKADPNSSLEPSTPPVPPLPSLPTTDEGVQELLSVLLTSPDASREIIDTLEAGSLRTEAPGFNAMGTSPDFSPSANIVGSIRSAEATHLEDLGAGPSPIAEELSWKSGPDVTATRSPGFMAHRVSPGLDDAVAMLR